MCCVCVVCVVVCVCVCIVMHFPIIFRFFAGHIFFTSLSSIPWPTFFVTRNMCFVSVVYVLCCVCMMCLWCV